MHKFITPALQISELSFVLYLVVKVVAWSSCPPSDARPRSLGIQAVHLNDFTD